MKYYYINDKELGIPTANLDTEPIKDLIEDLGTGIFFGFSSIGSSSTVYKMVMSLGWNPYYKNSKKSVEPWLLHEFENVSLEIVNIGFFCFISVNLNFYDSTNRLGCEKYVKAGHDLTGSKT